MYIYQRYQNWSLHVLYAPLNTTRTPQTATGSCGSKVGHPSTKPQHSWHYSLDKKHYFFHFYEKIHALQKGTFFMKGTVHPFFIKSGI
jgi:hypothetical protein